MSTHREPEPDTEPKDDGAEAFAAVFYDDYSTSIAGVDPAESAEAFEDEADF